jgi:hypothetical protein
MLGQKSIVALLKLNFHQLFFWFNVSDNNMKDLIDV